MGHATVTATLDAQAMQRAHSRVRESRRVYPTSGGQRVLEELAYMGVQEWRENGETGDASIGLNIELTTPMSQQLARRHIGGVHVTDNHTVIVPMVADKDVIKRTKTLQVLLPADEAAQLNQTPYRAFDALAADGIDAVEIVGVAVPKLRKPVAKSCNGKLVTKYFLVDMQGDPVERAGNRFDSLPITYDSQASAKAAGIALMEQRQGISRLNIHSIQMRETEDGVGHAVAAITRPEQQVKVTITYMSHTVKPGAPVGGYLVAFDIHI